MAGPSGTKLIDLHMTDRGLTTEMQSPSRRVGADSDFRKAFDKAARHWSKKLENVTPGLLLLGLNGAVMSAALVLADLVLDQLHKAGIDLLHLLPQPLQATGPVGLTVFIGVPVAIGLVAAMEMSGLMRSLRSPIKFDDPSELQKDARFSAVMKLKPEHIHFGNLPVSYDITEKGLLIRSLGDRFVAVLAITPDTKVKLAPEDISAAYRGWYGDNVTPPLIVEVEDADYASKLIISGIHFETPGADLARSIKRAEAFKTALGEAPAGHHGGHHDDHH
ncbi:MAG: hypothetical protein ACK6DM_10170 [Alphaproteobacteria bacterium]|jgi:hypothetical protein